MITDEQIAKLHDSMFPAPYDGHANVVRFARAVLALAAQKGEPFGWWFTEDPAVCSAPGSGFRRYPDKPQHTVECIALYTAPAPAVPMSEVDLQDDDALRFAQRVLESDAPESDRKAARDMLVAIRIRVRKAHAALTAPAPGPDWLHLKRYGYAPGNYMCRCHRCGQVADGLDKRANCCRPCAEDAHAAKPAAQSQPMVDLESWINDVVREFAELPDRDSPEDQPDVMLVRADELRSILRSTPPPKQPAVPEDVAENAARWVALSTAVVESLSREADSDEMWEHPFLTAFEKAIGDHQGPVTLEQYNAWADAARAAEKGGE